MNKWIVLHSLVISPQLDSNSCEGRDSIFISLVPSVYLACCCRTWVLVVLCICKWPTCAHGNVSWISRCGHFRTFTGWRHPYFWKPHPTLYLKCMYLPLYIVCVCVCVYVHTHNFAVKCKITFVICLVNYYFNYHVDFTVSVLLSGAKIVFSSQTFSWPFTSSSP